MADSLSWILVIVVAALAFDFINGFHDSANSISTVVSTRVLSPKYAVLWAAFFNFSAVLFVGVPVAKMIGTGIISPTAIDNLVVLAALGGSIAWNLFTWYSGLPSSSSHALIGGLIGVAVGVLYAPKSGKETREDIARKAEELMDKAKEEYERAVQTSKRAYEAAREKVAEAEEKAGELAGKGKEALQDQKSRLKRALDAGVEAYKEEKAKTT